MAGSTTKTVYEIFQSMEYGPASVSSTASAQVKLSGFFYINKSIVCSLKKLNVHVFSAVSMHSCLTNELKFNKNSQNEHVISLGCAGFGSEQSGVAHQTTSHSKSFFLFGCCSLYY